jgi:hypothetical protein
MRVLTKLQNFYMFGPDDCNVFFYGRIYQLARNKKMGSQGNYNGSGAINQHKHLAMRGEVPSGGSNEAENTPKGSGSDSGVVGTTLETVHANVAPPTAAKNVRAVNPSE